LSVGAHPVTLSQYPGFLPGLAVSLVLATLLRRRVADWLGTSEPVAWLLLASLGGIVAATLTPGSEVFGQALPSPCDTSRVTAAPLAEYAALGESGLNVLLFVPLGIAVALLPRSQVMVLAVVGGVLLPVAIEAIQLAAVPLGRVCQTADITDNAIGFALGFGAGSIALWIGRRSSRRIPPNVSPSG